jgi:hypothetical protein
LSGFLSVFRILCIVLLVLGILIAMCSLTSTTIIRSSLQNYYAYAHLSIDNNRTQQWISQKDGIKILFTYEPEKPIIDTFTELKFSVLNLTSSEHLKDFMARVVVTNGQRLFKFENITVADGDFSVKYIFPDDGTHQIVTRISKETSVLTLASFNVFVPHQSPPSILNPFPASSPVVGIDDSRVLINRIVVAILLPVAITVVLVFMLRRGKSSKRKREDNA